MMLGNVVTSEIVPCAGSGLTWSWVFAQILFVAVIPASLTMLRWYLGVKKENEH